MASLASASATVRPFAQVDVFANGPVTGNPVAVVHDAEDLSEEEMAAFARWTNLSETTFLLPPTDPTADYRLRIFTPGQELPFAGHPTLGSAHAWSEAGGQPRREGVVVQECGAGLVEIAQVDGRQAFAAPPFVRSGVVDDETLARVATALRIDDSAVIDAQWIDNGPGWIGVVLATAHEVLALRPDVAAMAGLEVGVIGAYDEAVARAIGADYEVRAFCPDMGIVEDPVTGSLNAGFAVWLTGTGALTPRYRVRQGTALDRDGRVEVSTGDDGRIWVGGACRTIVRGTVHL